MKEVTRIMTITITQIETVPSSEPYNYDMRDFKEFAAAMRVVLDVDNVDISNVQYFEREVEDGKERQ